MTIQTPRVRPAAPLVAFVACYLLAGVAALRIVAAITAFYALPEITRHYSDLEGDASAGRAAGAGLVLLALLSLVVAVVYLLLAILDSKGLNPARIITWVVGGLTLCVATPGLAIDIYDGVAWYQRLSLVVTWATLAFTAAAIVLLALPSANRFHRTPRRPQPLVYGAPFPVPGTSNPPPR